MNKLLLLSFLLIGISAKAQYPVTQTLGSPTTTTLIRGVSGAQFGVLIQSPYVDTLSINSSTTLDNVPGVLVRTSDGNLWIRSANASTWLQIATVSAAGDVYTAGDNQNSLVFNAFRYMLTTQYNGPVVSSIRLETEADSAWYRFTIAGNVPGKTSSYFITQSDSLNRMTTLGLNPGFDSTKGFQVLMNKTSANIGYRSGASHLSSVADSLKGVQIDATTKVKITGNSFLFPRLTTADRTALPTPEEGLAVYDLDLHKLYIWDGTTWQAAW